MSRLRSTVAALFLVVGVAVAAAPMPALAQYASQFRIGGQVAHPTTYDLAGLQALPSTKLDVAFQAEPAPVNSSFTGVLLWDLLNIAGVVTNPNVKNDILRKQVMVTGSDGYEAVFSLGEIDPFFGGHQVIVAYLQDGNPLDQSSGFARIIAPNDKAGGRDVFNIVRIRVTGPIGAGSAAE